MAVSGEGGRPRPTRKDDFCGPRLVQRSHALGLVVGKQAGSSATCRGGTGTGNPSLVMTYAFGITTALFKDIYISYTMFLPHHLRACFVFFSISLVHVGFLGGNGFEGCTIV